MEKLRWKADECKIFIPEGFKINLRPYLSSDGRGPYFEKLKILGFLTQPSMKEDRMIEKPL
jgi:hypothetical protein